MRRVLDIILGSAAAIACWQILVWVTGVPHFILPGPIMVAKSYVTYGGLIFENTLVTLSEVLAGILLGLLFGVATGFYLMVSPLARRFLLPLLVFSQAVPVFALAPILTLWFGYGIWSKIVMTILIIYFPVTSNFYDGLRQTNPGLIDLAKTMGASRNSTLFRLRFPAALPSLGSGMRLAAVYAPIGAVIGEWVGASKGLGYLMLWAKGQVKIDLLFASLIVLALMAVALHFTVSIIARRLTNWSQGHKAQM